MGESPCQGHSSSCSRTSSQRSTIMGVKAKLKPASECRQIALRWPDCRHSVPSVQVFFEDVADALPQRLNGLILAVAVRHQIDRRLSL